MDADSSYGGSDTAQDNSSFMDATTTSAGHSDAVDVTTAVHTMPSPPSPHPEEPNSFYHKNEVTLPVNYDETDFQNDKSNNKQPHYLSTANLNINETLENHSNLEEMSKNYKSTSQLNVMDSPRVRKKSNAGGIDNPAFNHKADEPEVKSTFDHNRPYNGDRNSTNVLGLTTSPNRNDEPLTEAVNLELINLKPGSNGKDVTGPYENGTNGTTSTGIPVKKEADAEMGNPYDEYFVPVNEHRKYMRGEKLYVTMDKRNKKKRNKCLCWGICLCIVAAAVIIGILAAVGVIGNQGAHPVQEVSARHFDGSSDAAEKPSDVKVAGGIFGLPPDLVNNERQTRPSTPGLPVTTVSSNLPTTETSMIEVPRALESEIVIDNLDFTNALKDKNSTQFKQLAKALEDQIKNSLFSANELNNGAANIEVKIIDFESGSVVVKYRITWKFKDGLHNTKDPIDPEMLKRRMRNALGGHSGSMMGAYHVKEDGVQARKILDMCQIDNNQCEHMCSFDYNLADFVCSCPIGQYLAEDKKKCNDYPPEPEHVDPIEPEITETTPAPEPEPALEDTVHSVVHSNYGSVVQPEPTAEPEPEPTSKPERQNPHEVSHENFVRFHEIEEVPVAEPTAEPAAEPTPEPKTEPTPEPAAEPTPEPKAEPAAEPTAGLKTEPTPEPATEPTAEPAAEPTAEPAAEPTAEPAAEPTAEPAAEPTAKSAAERTAEPAAEPTAEPSPGPTVEPTAQPSHDHKYIDSIISKHETTTEPTAEPTAKPTVSEFEMNHKEVTVIPSEEPIAEPTSEPNEGDRANSHVISIGVASTPEPSAEPTAEPSAEPITTEFEHKLVYRVSSTPEQAPEPTAEPTTQKMMEISSENVPEHGSTEPGAEPTAQPSTMSPPSSTEEAKPRVNHYGEEIFAESDTTTSSESDVTTATSEMTGTTTIATSTRTANDQKESMTIDVVINNEEITMQPGNVTVTVGTTTEEQPKIYEVTTQPSSASEMTKIFSELHKVIDSSSTTEIVMITTLTNNQTHSEINNAESNESTSGMDGNMSPFLPEIDNDTFVNKLHLGEHNLDHTQKESYDDDDIYVTSVPPRLDDDEMNTTNPYDLDPKDAGLRVIPLDQASNETNSTENVTMDDGATPLVVVSENPSMTTMRASENLTTLPPEIINNVHSNQFFEKMGEPSTQPPQNDSTLQDLSDEDLLAVETTTSGVKSTDNHGVVGIRAKEVIPTTIHADIIDTVTETVLFTSNDFNVTTTTSSSIMVIPPHSNKTENDSQINATTSHQYEVKETVADVTTSGKLFLAISTSTTSESPNQNLSNDLLSGNVNYQDLSVLPLNPEDEDDNNQLDSNNESTFNDITQEERSIFDKFHHGFNDIVHDDNVKSTTTATDEEIMSTSLQNDKDQHPFSDIRPVTEGYSILSPIASRCSPHEQFHCVNGTSMRDGSYCISENDRCDSVNDCTDGSDEIDCEKEGCPHNFQCASGQCLKRHLVCDGIQNCNDGSDETSCEHWTCRYDEMSCGTGRRCIPKLWKCDGREQCPDGIDEHGCSSLLHCGNNTFQCHEQGTCVPNSWRCDGKTDCLNSEDERACVCSSDEYKCAIGGGCVKSQQRCDGKSDCADESDEWNCLKLYDDNAKRYLQVAVGNSSWYPVCSSVNWNQTFSDNICQELGFSGSILTETVAKPIANYSGFYQLKSNASSGLSALAQLDRIESCDSLVSVTCQEFTCGIHTSDVNAQSARIIGGNVAADTQWPSLTLLYNKKKNLQCTATLLAPLWVVASHSCVSHTSDLGNSPSDWILYAGSSNFFGSIDNSTTQLRQIKTIVSHPQAKFSHFEFINDLVLMELSSPLALTRNVSAVCLPEKDIQPRQLCIIAGWGVRMPGEVNQTQYLHYLPVPIIDSQECNSTKHYNGMINEDKICAGFTDSEKTPCYNDEGAPLMCFSNSAGLWELHGVLSHHDNCGKGKHPAIYTSLNTKIRQWVVNTIGQNPMRSA